MFTDDAHIDYSSAGAVVGSRDEVVDWFAANFGVVPWSMHYITNIESDDHRRYRDGAGDVLQPDAVARHGGDELTAAGITTTNSCALPTVGAAVTSARRTSGSPTPRPRRAPLNDGDANLDRYCVHAPTEAVP